MKSGYCTIILRDENHESVQVSHQQVSQNRTSMQKWCYVFGGIRRAWSTMRSFDLVRSSLLNSTNNKWSVWVTHLKKKDRLLAVEEGWYCCRITPGPTQKTLETISDLGWEILSHAAYSPDLAPSDYYLFRSLQHLIGSQFKSVEQVEKSSDEFIESKPSSFFRSGIRQLPER